MTKEELKSMFGGIVEHYNHACDKHPFFADVLCENRLDWGMFSESKKREIRWKVDNKYTVTSTDILHAEMYEIYDAFSKGEYTQARYEVLDAIAVLLRMDDMIRDFQEKKEEKPND